MAARNVNKNNPSVMDRIDEVAKCPICLDTAAPPIAECEVGHIMCKKCQTGQWVLICPQCRGPMSNRRHVAFEQLLETVRDKLQISCRYTLKGCTFKITSENRDSHERDCRHRTFKCEGKQFANWNCEWTGDYENLERHFKQAHKNNTLMQYKTEATQKIDFKSNFKDIHLISFLNGQAYFYYKHCVDPQKQKIYWVFQYIGLRSNAEHFSYEFEVHNGPIRKFKINEICHNDTINVEDLFELEKCVVLSFAAARNFLNYEGEIPFRFRIIKNKQTHGK